MLHPKLSKMQRDQWFRVTLGWVFCSTFSDMSRICEKVKLWVAEVGSCWLGGRRVQCEGSRKLLSDYIVVNRRYVWGRRVHEYV